MDVITTDKPESRRIPEHFSAAGKTHEFAATLEFSYPKVGTPSIHTYFFKAIGHYVVNRKILHFKNDLHAYLGRPT